VANLFTAVEETTLERFVDITPVDKKNAHVHIFADLNYSYDDAVNILVGHRKKWLRSIQAFLKESGFEKITTVTKSIGKIVLLDTEQMLLTAEDQYDTTIFHHRWKARK